MPCRAINIGGHLIIACGGRRAKPKPCSVCSAPGGYLCDWPLSATKTCDAPLCAEHRQRWSPGVDYCPKHRQDVPEQTSLVAAEGRADG